LTTSRLYRLLLRLYPANLREEHREEMLELFEHQRGRGRRLLLVVDFLSSLLVAHVRAAHGWRAPRGSEVVYSIGKDLVFAFRNLRRAPSVSVLAVLALALGIGANTAIFSVVHAVALRPLPYPDPDRLVTVFSARRNAERTRGSLSQPDLRDIQRESRLLDSLAGYSGTSLTLTGLGEAEVVRGTQLTDGLLRVFGLKPLLGRDLDASDNVPGGPQVVVIGYRFWQERVGGENPLGNTLTVEGEPHEIVGVAPAGFDFPAGAELYRPLYLDIEDCGRGCHLLKTVGRLREEATLERAGEELSILASRLESEYANTNTGKGFGLEPLEETLVGASVKTGLFVLLAAVSVVLLIACANVAHLLLAKASERSSEMAVRSALGASGSRLLRQLLLESLALALLGGLAGVGIAALGVNLLLSLAPSTLPRIEQVSLDGIVLLFTVAVTLLVTLASGLAPALDLSRTSLASSIGHGGRTERRRARSRAALLAAQVALSLVLLFAAGLLLRSFAELRATSLGFDKEGVLMFDLSLPEAKYREVEDWIRTFETVEARLRALPGVQSVGSIFGSPMGVHAITTEVDLLDRPASLPGQELHANVRVVTPGYLDTLAATLLRGRGIEESDRRDVPPIAFVNESFVETYFPGKEVLDQQVRIHATMGYPEEAPRTIVGVMADVRSQSVMREAVPEIYVPFAQMGSSYLTILLRSRGETDALLPSIRREIAAIDPDIPLRRVELLAAAVDRSIGPTRFYFLLLAIFATLAVSLAAIGLYGVVAFLVSRRTREIGIRMALGARAGGVLRLVVVEALRPTLAGVALGLGGVYLTSKALSALLYNVEPLDGVVLASVSALLLAVALVAVLVPARRATRISPASTLRAEV
jgi:putative ABC transport system permease protein